MHKWKYDGKRYDPFFISIHYKMEFHNYFLSQLDNYTSVVNEQINNVGDKDIMVLDNHFRLIAYFEAILSNAYSIMEDIAKITLAFFPKNNLGGQSFHDQLDWFLIIKNNKIDPEYTDYLQKNMKWYSELREMRAESTHFLSGTLSYRNQDSKLVPVYNIKLTSARKRVAFESCEASKEINFAHDIGKKMSHFLEFFGKHFIKLFETNTEVSINILPKFDESKTKILGYEKTKVKLKEFLSGKIKLNEYKRVMMKKETDVKKEK